MFPLIAAGEMLFFGVDPGSLPPKVHLSIADAHNDITTTLHIPLVSSHCSMPVLLQAAQGDTSKGLPRQLCWQTACYSSKNFVANSNGSHHAFAICLTPLSKHTLYNSICDKAGTPQQRDVSLLNLYTVQ